MRIEIQQLTKKYGKEKVGLLDFSLTLENGIIGLLGPNGAGKSTLMKILATISRPTTGAVTLDGHDLVKEPQPLAQSAWLFATRFWRVSKPECLRVFGIPRGAQRCGRPRIEKAH